MAARILATILILILTLSSLSFSSSARTLSALVETQPLALTYHKGRLLSGPISVNLIWYGKFTPAQRAIITDFIASLSAKSSTPPSVAAWWKTVEKYHLQAKNPIPLPALGAQTLDDSYSLGKRLTSSQLADLAARGAKKGANALSVVLTSDDVAVDGFCMRCGTHGVVAGSGTAYIWVGNSATQCPGQCAWPFHQPVYGPQAPPLVAPNGDVGVDGMIINVATLLAGAVTNPFGNGFYQGSGGAPLEAATACAGVYGKGAYPGYPGELMVDQSGGGSYNANGSNGRRYLLPAVVDPTTKACVTPV